MKQRYATSTLLEDSQLADHFFSLVKGLTGRDAIYKNPGTSLRSYVVANCTNRLLDLDDSLQAIREECLSFNHDPEVRKAINTVMRDTPYELIKKISQIVGPSPQVSKTVSNLNSLVKMLDSVENLEDNDSVNIWVQTLIELKNAIEDLTQVLESLPIKAPK